LEHSHTRNGTKNFSHELHGFNPFQGIFGTFKFLPLNPNGHFLKAGLKGFTWSTRVWTEAKALIWEGISTQENYLNLTMGDAIHFKPWVLSV